MPDNLSEEAKRIFGSWKSGQLYVYRRTTDHIAYGEAVRELFDATYPHTAALDVQDAIHFIEMVNESTDPRIMSYLQTEIHPKLINPVSGGVKVAKFGIFGFVLGLYPLIFDQNYTMGDYLGDVVCSPMGGGEGSQ